MFQFFEHASARAVDKVWIEYVKDMILLWNPFPSGVELRYPQDIVPPLKFTPLNESEFAMTAPAINTDLLAYNFNLGTTSYTSTMRKADEPAVAEDFGAIGKSFMHELAREGDVLSAEVVFDKGGAIDTADDEGRRPLHEAAFFGRLDMVKFLTMNGALMDAAVHPFGYTALWFAVAQGHMDVVRYLLERGAHIHVTDALSGQGLLHLAAQKGDTLMAGLLIAAGINTLSEDRRGQTARDYAARHCHTQLEKTLLKVMEHHARTA